MRVTSGCGVVLHRRRLCIHDWPRLSDFTESLPQGYMQGRRWVARLSPICCPTALCRPRYTTSEAGTPRFDFKNLLSRATRYTHCCPSPGPTVNVYNMPACPSRARPNLSGSSRRPAPRHTHTRTHTHAHAHTHTQTQCSKSVKQFHCLLRRLVIDRAASTRKRKRAQSSH